MNCGISVTSAKGQALILLATTLRQSIRKRFLATNSGTTFLLEGTEVYAQQAKVSVGLVRQKRQLGIYFGLFALAMLTKDNWRASEDHPSAQIRINAVRDLMTAQRSDMAAAIAHVAFAVLASVWPGTPTLY